MCPAVAGLNQNAQPGRDLRLVGWNARRKLGDEPGMVKVVHSLVLQVGPARAHPERVALEHDILAGNSIGVKLDRPTAPEGAPQLQPQVGETLLPRECIQIMRQRLLPGHILRRMTESPMSRVSSRSAASPAKHP